MKYSIHFWSSWLFVASIIFSIQALTWLFFGSFDPFGIYERLLAQSLLEANDLSPGEARILQFGTGLLGATTCAFFVLFAFIARIPFRRKEKWAQTALMVGVLVWFIVDSIFSIVIGATFNVFLVNLPCLIILIIPLVFSRGHFVDSH